MCILPLALAVLFPSKMVYKGKEINFADRAIKYSISIV